MDGETINVLLVDADAAEARAVEAKLASAGIARFQVLRASDSDEAIACSAASAPEVVIVGSNGQVGSNAVARLRATWQSVPVVVLTQEDAEPSTCLGASRNGAQEYRVATGDGPALAYGLLYVIERKRAEEALEKSEAFYHSLVESLPQLIFRKDLDGRFTFGNGRFCNEIGRRLEQIVGKTDADFFPPELAAKYRADDRRVIESGRSIAAVEEHVTPHDEKLYVQVIKTPLYDASGRIIGTQGIFWDVTEKYRAEEDLRQAYAELAAKEAELLATMSALKESHEELIQAQLQLIQAEKMESVGRLAAGVAHEVKNPLAILLMGLEYLGGACMAQNEEKAGAAEGEGDSAVAAVITAMRDAVERADTIVRGLVDFSANRQLDLVAQDLDAVIERSLLLVKHELTNARVTAVHERRDGAWDAPAPPPLPCVTVDATRMQQVFVNLFINAIHAMPGGGTLTVRAYIKRLSGADLETARDEGSRQAGRFRAGEEVVIAEVDDTGTGIPSDKLAKVWDPFFTTKPTGRGTGLGLPVTRKIVELHEGMITIGNRGEGGARVTLMFHAAPLT
jgi:PAS domain S-box-containing protein